MFHVVQVTKCIQTGELESVHSLYNKYAPKRLKFGHDGITARLQVAALDHNYSVDRKQARTGEGVLRFKQEFSKGAKAYVVKPIRQSKKWSFRTEILFGIVDRCANGSISCLFYFLMIAYFLRQYMHECKFLRLKYIVRLHKITAQKNTEHCFALGPSQRTLLAKNQKREVSLAEHAGVERGSKEQANAQQVQRYRHE